MNHPATHGVRFTTYGTPIITKRQINEALDDFAEHLANGLDTNEAADEMRVTRGTGCVLLHMLRQRMGAQAS